MRRDSNPSISTDRLLPGTGRSASSPLCRTVARVHSPKRRAIRRPGEAMTCLRARRKTRQSRSSRRPCLCFNRYSPAGRWVRQRLPVRYWAPSATRSAAPATELLNRTPPRCRTAGPLPAACLLRPLMANAAEFGSRTLCPPLRVPSCIHSMPFLRTIGPRVDHVPSR